MDSVCFDGADGIQIEYNLVADADRLQFLPVAFGARVMMRGEGLVYDWMGRLCPEYDGGFWAFYWLTNGGFYMATATPHPYRMTSSNGFEGELSSGAAGIVATLYALCQLAAEFEGTEDGDLMSRRYHQLRDYAGQHPESGLIFRAID